MARKDDSPTPATKGLPLPGLKALRRRRAITQRELAELAGITQGTIWQLETGRRTAYPTTVKRLSRALGVAPQDLTCGGSAEQQKGPP